MSSRSHSYFQDLLEKHISGAALAPDDRFDLFDHIETCDACRDMLEAEERLTARMKTVPRLVAPSDLRSKILSRAIRDHQERTTTPSEDPALVDVLAPRASDSARLSATHDEMPVLPGSYGRSWTCGRRIWRRASPVLAISFLSVASIGALYTGQFQGIPLAGQAQQLVWAMVDSVAGKSGAPEVQSTPTADSAVAFNDSSSTMVFPMDEPMQATVESTVGEAQPFAGTELLAGRIRDVRSWLAAADLTIATLAHAAKASVPGPAEDADPQIAALVLRPTDPRQEAGGFERSALAKALESMATSQPGARLASSDQFATNGHRYRLYTLELPAGCTNQLMQCLNPYTAPEDGQIVNALVSQDHLGVDRDQTVKFFSSNGEKLRSALETMTPVAASAKQERVRVVVVE